MTELEILAFFLVVYAGVGASAIYLLGSEQDLSKWQKIKVFFAWPLFCLASLFIVLGETLLGWVND